MSDELTNELKKEREHQIDSPFPKAKAHLGLRKRQGDPHAAPVQKWEFKHKVFVLFKKPESCRRCQADFAQQNQEDGPSFPEECPHTSAAEYIEVRQKIINEDYRLGSLKEEFTKEGDVLISLCWVEPMAKNNSRNSNLKGPEL